MKNCTCYLTMLCLITACSTAPKRQIDASAPKPKWAEGTRITWADGDQIYFRHQYSVKGDERLNGCYQLAKLEAKEALIREISEELRGQIDNAQQSLSESAELILSQVRSSEYSGNVTGMRVTEQFHERTVTNDIERLDCFVLASIKKSDYENVKRQILFKVAEADPELKKAINQRSVKFFLQQPEQQQAAE